MKTFKKILKLLLPPLIFGLFKRFYERLKYAFVKPEWEYVPMGWQTTDAKIKGWSQASILEVNKAKWVHFLDSLKGTKALGVSPEASVTEQENIIFHNVIMSYAYALNIAAIGRSRISMLDWGGGIGHYYMISKALCPDLTIDYTCKDFELFCTYAQSQLPETHFYSDDRWKQHTYDFVLSSSSLQYSEDWAAVVTDLATVTTGYLFVTRLPVVQNVSSYVIVQRPYAYGYDTEYLGWCLNRSELVACAEKAGLKLVREFLIESAPLIKNAPEQCQYMGFLFRQTRIENK